MVLKDDPRLDPALKTVLKKVGLDEEALDPAVKLTDSKETKLAYLSATEPLYQALSDIVFKLLAWPYHATHEDLSGLPPHVIYVNELDPLRDEGIAYHNKLEEAKVQTSLTILKGTVHATEGLFPEQLPEIHQQVQEDIKRFAENAMG